MKTFLEEYGMILTGMLVIGAGMFGTLYKFMSSSMNLSLSAFISGIMLLILCAAVIAGIIAVLVYVFKSTNIANSIAILKIGSVTLFVIAFFLVIIGRTMGIAFVAAIASALFWVLAKRYKKKLV